MRKGDAELLSPLLLPVSNTQSLSQPENRHPAGLPFFLYLFGTERPRKPQGQEEGSQEWLCQVLGCKGGAARPLVGAVCRLPRVGEPRNAYYVKST